MYSKDIPKAGEDRYYSFAYPESGIHLLRVRIIRVSYAIFFKVIEPIVSIGDPYNKGDDQQISRDYSWNLQKTLEDAKRVMLLMIFSKGTPPWE